MATATLPPTRKTAASCCRGRRWLWPVLLALAVLGGWGALRWLPAATTSTPTTAPRTLPTRVSALGRLAPEGEVIAIAPPTPTGAMAGARVEKLLVGVGDRVKAGQVVAQLDTYRSRLASVAEAEARVAVATAKVAQAKAGAKPEEIKAQEAMIRRTLADLEAAQEEHERAQRLGGTGAFSREEITARRMKFEQCRAAVEQARAQLDALKAVRPVDVKTAEAELLQAEATLTVSRADLDNTEVRSPLTGRVLRIRARPGERVGDAGILDVGNTDAMQVVAEVYEEDVGKIQLGNAAKIRVPTLGVELTGEVVSKDLVVSRKNVFSNDPVADIDARVVEVRIRLSAADGGRVSGLSNARAEVVIEVSQ